MTVPRIPSAPVSRDDPQVKQAMAVWDGLSLEEQRNVFQGMAQAVTAFGRTKNVDHLVRLSQSINEMVLLEQQPGFTESRRTPTERSQDPGEGMGITEVVRRLRE